MSKHVESAQIQIKNYSFIKYSVLIDQNDWCNIHLLTKNIEFLAGYIKQKIDIVHRCSF